MREIRQAAPRLQRIAQFHIMRRPLADVFDLHRYVWKFLGEHVGLDLGIRCPRPHGKLYLLLGVCKVRQSHEHRSGKPKARRLEKIAPSQRASQKSFSNLCHFFPPQTSGFMAWRDEQDCCASAIGNMASTPKTHQKRR